MSEIEELRKGSRIALSRILSQVENGTKIGKNALDELFPFTGKAHKIGITGPPGSGKSTLVNGLAHQLRKLEGQPRVAIIAVDPTSPFTGGAILGDRVRMLDLQKDPGIFIRSMASRGALGGLSSQTEAFSQVFDAAGYEYVLIETVGAGQSEVDIVNLAHTTIVVDVPGLGDDIQSIKAGILEIADILVVNKADLPGADLSVRYLKTMIEMGYRPLASSAGKHSLAEGMPNNKSIVEDNVDNLWLPPILKTVARDCTGVERLVEEVLNHKNHLLKTGKWQTKEFLTLHELVKKQIASSLVQDFFKQLPEGLLEEQIQLVVKRIITPATAAENLLAYNQNRTDSHLLE